MPQTTIISLYKYSGFKNKWKALARMGKPPISKKIVSGLSFFKPLGPEVETGFQ